jgi:hypothetical protein
MEGMGQIESIARSGQNSLTPGMFSNAQQMISGGGLSAEQRGALKPLQEMANMTPGTGNPYMMDVLAQSANKARDSVSGMFSAGGRYGGGAHQGTVANEVGDIYSRGLAGQMNIDLDRKMNAANSLQDIYGQGANRALAYTGLAPQLDEMRFADANRLIGVGAAQRGELQTELQSNIDRWNANQMRPWDMLNLYNQTVSGIAPYGGSQTSSVPRGSPIAGILGGASMGAGLAGQLGMGGSPWMWPMMLGGGAMGMFG